MSDGLYCGIVYGNTLLSASTEILQISVLNSVQFSFHSAVAE